MKLAEIKRLCEIYSTEELEVAENEIYEDLPASIAVEGEDEGEKLTHLMASQWCLALMAEENILLKDALRRYTQKVRNTIN